MTDKLPRAQAALVDNAGVTTPPFYRYFQALDRLQAGTASAADIAAINAQIAAIQAEIAALPKASYPKLQVSAPLTSAGLLQNGFAKLGLTVANSVTINGVALQLDGDADAPGNTYLYSTGTAGAKGWNALGGMLAGTTNNIAKTVNADGTVTFNLATVTDSGAGTFKLITRDTFGRLSGTKSGTTSDVPEGTNLYYTDARVDARLSPGYIDGLQMQWVSGTAVTVSSGTAYIPGLGRYLQSNAAIALSGLALSASTWYHLYLYSNTGTPAVECVTAAPVLYYGTAHQKTGDASRRYLGSVKSDAAGQIIQFLVDSSGAFWFQVAPSANGLRALSNGVATTRTPVSLSSGLPITATHALLEVINTDASVFVNMSNPFSAAGGVLGVAPGGPKAGQIIVFNTDSNQAVDYYYTTAPTAGFYIDIYGFSVNR